ncbi:MAG: leucyl/phenylalanyl-tRNA--protein transferase [Gammaproteobacteria bacterium PRO9]|nr:leucyl/phenylalanyl-tRNA--protein transferase [Gammaproteobacteria bacterium PRO9]
MIELHQLRPGDPPDAFPDPSLAAVEPNGLLAIGGDLEPARLLAAYARGIFPWYEAGQPILWWSPDPRAILWPARLHISRSLRRTLRRNHFRVSIDLAFDAVVAACAETRRASGTWITAEMQAAYGQLHELGHAHAIEVWQGSKLVGGVYGVVLGQVFFGESMFSLADDASKVALVWLAHLADSHGLRLIDCQVPNPHLASLGSELLPRAEFMEYLDQLIPGDGSRRAWRHDPEPTAGLGTSGIDRVPLRDRTS